MNDLVVVSFDNVDAARRALASLRSLESQGQISFEDTAIVSRDSDGKTHVHNEMTGAAETGAAVGAIIGAIAAFAFPVVGIVVGAAAGAGIGAAMHTGVERSFVDEMKQQLTPGRSALFLVTRHANTDALVGALRPYEGEVIHTTLSDEQEEALRRALK